MSGEKDKYPRRDPTTAHRSVADEGCLVVVPSRAAVEVLNPVGGKIYSMLDGTHTADDIVRALVEEFDVNEDQARKDLDAFLDELRDREMLVTAGGNGGCSPEATDD
ncbi:MAG: PqqD family protein [Phycisphaerae bacterium]|nr:PqqD family protein [Phycisphaerae bacterium]